MAYRIVILSALVLLLGGFLTLRIGTILYARTQPKRRRLAATSLGTSTTSPTISYPVRYCSESHFHRPFRLRPWEAEGTFSLTDTHFAFAQRSSKTGRFLPQVEFAKEDCRVEYIPRSFLRDGGLSWFAIEKDGVRHYFNAGRQVDLSSGESTTTTGVYEAVSDSYVQSSRLDDTQWRA
ncbi:MAG: hypothetical protein KDD44_01425 [Bdellovibrionales bacterium]|nr:hypothetical protein [Bdellovibrionales bacterium]